MRREPDPDVLIASVLYLMSRYGRTGDPCVAAAVAQHLEELRRRREVKNHRLLRALPALVSQWQALAGCCPHRVLH